MAGMVMVLLARIIRAIIWSRILLNFPDILKTTGHTSWIPIGWTRLGLCLKLIDERYPRNPYRLLSILQITLFALGFGLILLAIILFVSSGPLAIFAVPAEL
jgi:hypothetical protein